MKLISEFLKRLMLETPTYWRKVRNLCTALSAGIAVIIVANQSGIAFDETLIQICYYLLAVFATMGVTAQATKV